MVTVKNHLIEHRLKEKKTLITAGIKYPGEVKNSFLC